MHPGQFLLRSQYRCISLIQRPVLKISQDLASACTINYFPVGKYNNTFISLTQALAPDLIQSNKVSTASAVR